MQTKVLYTIEWDNGRKTRIYVKQTYSKDEFETISNSYSKYYAVKHKVIAFRREENPVAISSILKIRAMLPKT